MDINLRYQALPEKIAPEIASQQIGHAPIIIVGAGPIGLAAAIDFASRGIKVILLEKKSAVSIGSRAICWSKRTLEIFDRLGVGEKMLAKGVTWKVGRTYWGDEEIYHYDLLPEQGHKNPAFINLQQYHVEACLIEHCQNYSDLIDLRFGTELIAFQQNDSHVMLDVQSEAGNYQLKADYLLACDGAHSLIRRSMDLSFEGVHFEEKFLIADVKMDAPFPQERWFWFEPSFHAGQSALLHKQPDNIYRIDFQLPSDADNVQEVKPENVRPRIAKLLQHDNFELDWVSIYQFHCRRIERLVHGRIIFAGDSAHIVSPFGARGGNGGIQDIDNLCWKLSYILQGKAGDNLLHSYHQERSQGTDENIANSARTTKFMSPNSAIEKMFRDNLLILARKHPFARRLINAGRLSLPCQLTDSPLHTTNDNQTYQQIGAVCSDAPLYDPHNNASWLLNKLKHDFTLLVKQTPDDANLLHNDIQIVNMLPLKEKHQDEEDLLEKRFPASCYLIRPDQHIAALWHKMPSIQMVNQAYHKAVGK